MFDLDSWLFPTPHLLHNHQSALTPNSCWSGGARNVTSGSIYREFMSTEEMTKKGILSQRVVPAYNSSRLARRFGSLWTLVFFIIQKSPCSMLSQLEVSNNV